MKLIYLLALVPTLKTTEPANKGLRNYFKIAARCFEAGLDLNSGPLGVGLGTPLLYGFISQRPESF